MSTETRPAFYALDPGGWRDYVTLVHVPYTLWHLSYVAIGAALAPRVGWGVLGLTLLAFALALGIGAHALDELHGRPLRTRIPSRALGALAGVTVATACGIGVGVALRTTLWLLAFVVAGAFLVAAYNLELFGGRFHGDVWFGLAWGAFPVLTSYLAQTGRVDARAVAAAAAATFVSLAQRALSSQVRTVRRRVERIDGTIAVDGRTEALEPRHLAAAPERALKLLTGGMVALAAALLLMHVD